MREAIQRKCRRGAAVLLAWVCLPCAGPLRAQASGWQPRDAGLNLPGSAQAAQGWVQLESSRQIHVQTRRVQTVDLEFVIQDGLHINAHQPRSPYLIPTVLTLHPPAGVRVLGVEYPQAKDYHFAFSPKDALSVYTGSLHLLVRLRAQQPGAFSLPASLHYQACDNHMCNPPKTLSFTLHGVAQ
jgi:hypothetical protein